MNGNANSWQPPPLDPSYHDPNVSLVVMREDVENQLDTARLALDGLVWICDAAANMNVKATNAGHCMQMIDIPPESLAALLRLVATQIEPAVNNPSLCRVLSERPDLFQHEGA